MIFSNDLEIKGIKIDSLINILPCNAYLKDANGRYIFSNQYHANYLKLASPMDAIGKTDYDLHLHIVDNSIYNTLSNSSHTFHEEKEHEFPLQDENGKVIGFFGIHLSEDYFKDQLSKEQEKFKNIIRKLVHDIRSPLASLLMFSEICNEINEEEKTVLKEATQNISDLINEISQKYKNSSANLSDNSYEESMFPILPYSLLFDIIAEVKNKYKDQAPKLELISNSKNYLSFIKVDPVELKQIITLILENLIHKFLEQASPITITYNSTQEFVEIDIVKSNPSLNTEHYKELYNIILEQTRTLLHKNNANLLINPQDKSQFKLILTFSKCPSISSIIDNLILNSNQTILILEESTTAYNSWENKVNSLNPSQDIQLKSFTSLLELKKFIKNNTLNLEPTITLCIEDTYLTPEFIDFYENNKPYIKQLVLITNNYWPKHEIYNKSQQLNAQIIVKNLLDKTKFSIKSEEGDLLKVVDAIIVDDNRVYLKLLTKFAFKNQAVDEFYDPESLLSTINKYPKNTIICLDNHFSNSPLTGIDIAKTLYSQGFTNLYLLSGKELVQDELPAYLIYLRKNDTENIRKYFKKNSEYN